MKKARRRIDVNLEELDRVLDGAREAPLSESDHGKLKETLPMQIRGPGDKSSSLAWENRAMREYAAPAWLDHRPAGERSRLWSFPAATAGEVALKDIASQRPTSGLYSATAKPAHRQNFLSALFSTFVKMISRSCSANPLKSIAGSANPVAQDGMA
jgi:hypothetical protein